MAVETARLLSPQHLSFSMIAAIILTIQIMHNRDQCCLCRRCRSIIMNNATCRLSRPLIVSGRQQLGLLPVYHRRRQIENSNSLKIKRLIWWFMKLGLTTAMSVAIEQVLLKTLAVT